MLLRCIEILIYLITIFCPIVLSVKSTSGVSSSKRAANLMPPVRCYCNHGSCVRNRYMCKSSLGRCYSRRDKPGQPMQHGCVDSLPTSERKICGRTGDLVRTFADNSDRGWSFVMCCGGDLCNYGKGETETELNSPLELQIDSNETATESRATGSKSLSDTTLNQSAVNSEGRIWFKAAVIAVPVAGLFVLLVLGFIAVRLLRTQSELTSNSPSQQRARMPRQNGLTKYINGSSKKSVLYLPTTSSEPQPVLYHTDNLCGYPLLVAELQRMSGFERSSGNVATV